MNEQGRAAASGTSTAVRSDACLLAAITVVLPQQVAGDEPSSSAPEGREAVAEPLPPVEPSPEVVPSPDPDEAHARVFRCNPFPSAAAFMANIDRHPVSRERVTCITPLERRTDWHSRETRLRKGLR